MTTHPGGAVPAGGGVSRSGMIGAGVVLLALAAMVVDHLLGDDPGLEDPVTFTLSAVLTLGTAVALFGWLVPRTAADRPERAATRGIWCSVVAALSVPVLVWLGVSFVVAGAGVALGLLGLHGANRRRALAAVVVGAAVLAVATGAYVVQAIDKL